MSRFEEPIRILSDLHLAHPGGRIIDARQLAPLLAGVKTVIFNGDTSEERMQKYRDKATAHLEALSAMCAEAGVEMVMVRGNHDPYSPPVASLDLCEGQVFVTHGDILYRDVSPWSRNIQFAREALRRIEEDYPADYRHDLEATLEVSRRVTLEMRVHQPKAKPGVIGKLKTLLSQAWPPTRPLTILRSWWQAPRRTEEVLGRYRPDARVFVVGHTHRAFLRQLGERILINTGAFLTLSKALAVDIDGERLLVRRIDEREGEFVLGKTLGEVELKRGA